MADQFHFDAETYAQVVRAEVPAYEELQETVAAASAEVTAGRILDLGTGTGETLLRVAARHRTARLVGIDESAEMLAQARAVLPDADLRVSRLQAELPDGPFDLVVSALAVHHLGAHEKADLFQRVRARLAPGGRFVLGDLVVPEHPNDAITPLNPKYDTPSTIAEQLQWLAAAGFVARTIWARHDLAVLTADAPGG